MAAEVGSKRDPSTLHRRPHSPLQTGFERAGGEVFVKMKCKYCGIIFRVATFEQIEHIQETQCYITMNGVNHSLRAVLE